MWKKRHILLFKYEDINERYADIFRSTSVRHLTLNIDISSSSSLNEKRTLYQHYADQIDTVAGQVVVL